MPKPRPTRTRQTIIKALLLVTIAVIIGLTGWYVIHTKHEVASIKPEASAVPDKPGTGARSCEVNVQDACVFAPSVDFYPSPQESQTNPDLKPGALDINKQIGGVITATNGHTITIKTTAHETFHITFPLDVISSWNTSQSSNYGNYKIGIGDTITLNYYEQPGEHSKDIGPSQISSSVLAISDDSAKTEQIKRYH